MANSVQHAQWIWNNLKVPPSDQNLMTLVKYSLRNEPDFLIKNTYRRLLGHVRAWRRTGEKSNKPFYEEFCFIKCGELLNGS